MTTPANQKPQPGLDEVELEERQSSTTETLNDPSNPNSNGSGNGYGQSRGYANEKLPQLGQVPTDNAEDHDHLAVPPTALSPNDTREQAHRFNDDLELLRAERMVSNAEHDLSRSRSRRQHQPEPEDVFAGNPNDEEREVPSREDHRAAHNTFILLRLLKKIPRCFRYLFYLIPGAGLLLIPILLGYFNDDPPDIGGEGGVPLMWFGIWLMILYCTLWGSRIVTSLMPSTFRFVATILGSTNHKKWKEVGRSLEIHTALFIWTLINLITFRTLVDEHRDTSTLPRWIDIIGKIFIAVFVLAVLNWIEKICIQWIATSFHLRTYSSRIEDNRSDIHHLVHLYDYAKERVANDDDAWHATGQAMGNSSNGDNPMAALQNNVRQVVNKAGVVANRVGNDFIGRKANLNHSKKIVYELLRNTSSAHSLARLLYRALHDPKNETVYPEDMRAAFVEEEESERAFGMFDKDFNGDISMAEMECVCNEIHLERKAIAASLKDLDSVIKKLDRVFFTIIFIVAVVLFIAILSESAAAGLASLGTVVLGLAWMLQATAQEFLQSIIFVFVKHPFDVGDRVTIYGSTGTTLQGDDYYVTEISLLYTEFKKMEGHIVQAPNSVLNNLFILNQRRSSGLADVVPLELGITSDPSLIEELKARMLEFCQANKRDFQPRVLTEVRDINNVQSFSMNFIFFHKSNWQNELLRLTRHNKFLAQLMAEIRAVGFQGPWQVAPGASREMPMHWSGAAPPSYNTSTAGGGGNDDGNNLGPEFGRRPSQTMHHTPSGASGTSVSRSAVRQVPTIEETMGDFQDVFESRKNDGRSKMSRLQSIREQSQRRSSASMERERAEATASGAAVRPSMDSQQSRRNIWGRARSRSTAAQQQQQQQQSPRPHDMV